MEKTKILLISYFYPPLGGPGVQRPLKMVYYLTKLNVEVDVLTVKSIIFHSSDVTLAAEDSANRVFRTVSLDPMSLLHTLKKMLPERTGVKKKSNSIYFRTPEKIKKIIRSSFLIDDKLLWLPFALIKALLIKKRYSFVVSTVGPYTSALVGFYYSLIKKIPFVIDYRDHWTMNPYFGYITKAQLRFAEFYERRILSHAFLISGVGKVLLSDLKEKYGSQLDHKMLPVYNGYDEKDFKNIKSLQNAKKKDNLLFSYVGNFYGKRTPDFFFKALQQMKDENIYPGDITVRFVGNYYTEFYDTLKKYEVTNDFEIIEQVDHLKALEYMAESDCLLLFIAKDNSNSVLTGKLFEYLRINKPILSMVPLKGEAAMLLEHFSLNYVIEPDDIEGIKKNFMLIYELLKKNDFKTIDNKLSEFSRENQTKKFLNRLGCKSETGVY